MEDERVEQVHLQLVSITEQAFGTMASRRQGTVAKAATGRPDLLSASQRIGRSLFFPGPFTLNSASHSSLYISTRPESGIKNGDEFLAGEIFTFVAPRGAGRVVSWGGLIRDKQCCIAEKKWISIFCFDLCH